MHDSPLKGMAVVLVHYHLAGGGVSKVIEISSAALAACGIPHVILSGKAPPTALSAPVRVVAGLGYASVSQVADSATLADRLLAAARDALGPGPHIWHFHNHSLGKNPALPGAVALLAHRGEHMVLQIHDLAEDGRPENHPLIARADMLYPVAPHIFYAFINRRDQSRFHAAGLPDAQSVYLPDPVAAPVPRMSDAPPSRPPLVLCPSRGIRRKNLGEIFLLAALSPPDCEYVTTLPPQSAQWLERHQEWLSFGFRGCLPVKLGVVGRTPPAPGQEATLQSWHDAATHYLTTSVAEGFGLGFLEPVAMGKPLFGRNLPEVTGDFAAAGIRPGRLYDRLLIPLSWPGAAAVEERIHISCRAWLEGYGRSCSGKFTARVCAALLCGSHIDFGNLPEDMQRDIILRAKADGGDDIFIEANHHQAPARTWLAETLENRQPACPPETLAPFSPEAHAGRLGALYARVISSLPTPPMALDPGQVLDQYLLPQAFHFLRC